MRGTLSFPRLFGSTATALIVLTSVTLVAGCRSEVGSFSRNDRNTSSQFAKSDARETVKPDPRLLAWRARQVMDDAFPPDAEPEAQVVATVAPVEMPEPPKQKPHVAVVATAEPPRGDALTRFVSFESAPFPYDGETPRGVAFLNAGAGGKRGHRTARGGVLWEDQTFSDDRVLVHVPAGFDPNKPAVMVVFFHGHGATLERDVFKRQRVPEQITASGANAVLVAPQFAVDARDSSAGRFWEPGGFSRFLDEAGERIAALTGHPESGRRFQRMPVLMVSYSGGFVPAAYSLKDVGASNRVRGVLLLDSLYGELDKFAAWASASPSRFLVSAYTPYTKRRNVDLERMLNKRGVSSGGALAEDLSRGGATFLATGPDAKHMDYVTQAWGPNPIADILRRMPAYGPNAPEPQASLDGSRFGRPIRSASVEP